MLLDFFKDVGYLFFLSMGQVFEFAFMIGMIALGQAFLDDVFVGAFRVLSVEFAHVELVELMSEDFDV